MLPIVDERCVMAVAAARNRDQAFSPSGSAVLLNENVGLTATHVLLDYWRRGEYAAEPHDGANASFSVELMGGFVPTANHYRWRTVHASTMQSHDLALLSLEAAHPSPVGWQFPILEVMPPRLASVVTIFGLQEPHVTDIPAAEGGGLAWHKTATVSNGRVTAVHGDFLDRGMYGFPCFETDARVEHSMSGGPVYNDDGNLCGIVAGGSGEVRSDSSVVSHTVVSLAWRALELFIDPPAGNLGASLLRLSGYEAARAGYLRASHLDLLEPTFDTTGELQSLTVRSA
jgi:hypothetical protein